MSSRSQITPETLAFLPLAPLITSLFLPLTFLQAYVFSKPQITSETLSFLPLVHSLLAVFNALINRNIFEPLNDMLLTIFMLKEDTFGYVKEYSGKRRGRREREEGGRRG
jgi:hypothetical protein